MLRNMLIAAEYPHNFFNKQKIMVLQNTDLIFLPVDSISSFIICILSVIWWHLVL